MAKLNGERLGARTVDVADDDLPTGLYERLAVAAPKQTRSTGDEHHAAVQSEKFGKPFGWGRD
jgi:hypothetical protein